jgi:hypothetical protein
VHLGRRCAWGVGRDDLERGCGGPGAAGGQGQRQGCQGCRDRGRAGGLVIEGCGTVRCGTVW